MRAHGSDRPSRDSVPFWRHRRGVDRRLTGAVPVVILRQGLPKVVFEPLPRRTTMCAEGGIDAVEVALWRAIEPSVPTGIRVRRRPSQTPSCSSREPDIKRHNEILQFVHVGAKDTSETTIQLHCAARLHDMPVYRVVFVFSMSSERDPTR